MSELLRMEHISKRFGSFYANKDINLSIEEGEIHTLLGENGAGKSTISRAFTKLAGKQEDTIETALAINGREETVVLTASDKANIHVFNSIKFGENK
mgnify:CR=1 FL=1